MISPAQHQLSLQHGDLLKGNTLDLTPSPGFQPCWPSSIQIWPWYLESAGLRWSLPPFSLVTLSPIVSVLSAFLVEVSDTLHPQLGPPAAVHVSMLPSHAHLKMALYPHLPYFVFWAIWSETSKMIFPAPASIAFSPPYPSCQINSPK